MKPTENEAGEVEQPALNTPAKKNKNSPLFPNIFPKNSEIIFSVVKNVYVKIKYAKKSCHNIPEKFSAVPYTLTKFLGVPYTFKSTGV